MRLHPLAVAAVVLATAACSSSTPSAAPSRPDAVSPAPIAPPASPSAAATGTGTVWVCRPGGPDQPCTTNLDATVVGPKGASTRAAFHPAAAPPADCFYVYPTVSKAPADNAPRATAPEVDDAVHAQAALFGSVCRVFAPAYRQVTLRALVGGRYADPAVQAIAYADVRAAWRDYLAHDNAGRPFVLIGHSQGAMLLTRLVRDEVERSPALRRRLLSAILLGANVTTAVGRDVGGDFTAIPTCRRPGQTGCVIAYSAFSAPPPSFAFFGRSKRAGQQVICTDPSVLAGSAGGLHPYVPADRVTDGPAPIPGTGFVAYPGALRGGCRTGGGATWLQVAAAPGSALPAFDDSLGPAWGLHIADVTLALGDLVEAVRRQEGS